MNQITLAYMSIVANTVSFYGMGYMLFRFANPKHEYLKSHLIVLISFRASMLAYMIAALLSSINAFVLLGGYMAAPELNTYSVLRAVAFSWIMVTVCVFHSMKVGKS